MSSTVLVLLFLWLSSALGLLVPQHYCDNHFRYASNDGNRTYIGVFTAPETRSRSLNINLNWQVTFEMQGRRNVSGYSDRLPYNFHTYIFTDVCKPSSPLSQQRRGGSEY